MEALSMLSIFLFLTLFSLPSLNLSYQIETNNGNCGNCNQLLLPSTVGPESLAFDCNGEGPYTGVSDGRILKWQGPDRGWTEFAVTSHHRWRDVCDGSNDPKVEYLCGRPLGLQFNRATCDLYIADAYFGLVAVRSDGGTATQLATSAEGLDFRFTNGLAIDQINGVVYFTDSSIWFQRWEFIKILLSGDRTGRLMKYDPRSKEVTVLLRGIAFANGVALSKDNVFVLVAETSKSRILRFWLQGPRAQTSEVFAKLPGNPDNIKRNARGEFWVALGISAPSRFQSGKASCSGNIVAVRLNEEGNILEKLYGNACRTLVLISEVEEKDQRLWIGSVVMPYVSIL